MLMGMILDTSGDANAALRRAIELAGGQSAFAKICGCTQGAISKRVRTGKPLAAEHVLPVEAAIGISRHELRPDIYPREEAAAPPPATARASVSGDTSFPPIGGSAK